MPPALPATQDAISQIIVACVLALVFALLVLEKAHRVLVIVTAVAALWLLTYLTPFHLISLGDAQRAIDLNVILLLAAMMAGVGVLKTTGVFEWLAGRLMDWSGGRADLILALVVWFTGIVSAFADNVTTVIFAYPMVAAMAATVAIPPAALLLPMVMASNIGGTATLIGDPPNIMIGSGAGLSFVEFLENLTLPVLLMLAVCVGFSRRYFRSALAAARPASSIPTSGAVITNPLLLKWCLGITALIFLGFLTHGLTGMPVAVPAVIGAALILVTQDVIHLRTHRASQEERIHGILGVMEREIEWPTLAFFAFLFIAVGAAVETGLIDSMARGLERFIAWAGAGLGLSEPGVVLFAALVILWASGVLSALIDNIPYVAVAIPVIARLAHQLHGDTEVLWWALALGACLGGNGSPVGASANVTVLGLADRAGQHISFREFLRFGVPMTALTLLIASLFLVSQVVVGKLVTLLVGGAGVTLYFLWAGILRRRA